jgi:creatinine amidohydrolase
VSGRRLPPAAAPRRVPPQIASRLSLIASPCRLQRRLLIATILACVIVAAPAVLPLARGQPLPSVLLEDLTWTELRDAVRGGTSMIIVPVGGTEQNGPHMTLGKHNARVKLLSERIARELGNTLVAPVIAYVPEGAIAPPTAHMRYPGTITVPEDAFAKVLEYAARSFRLHGFRDIVFLGDHGGYQKAEQRVAERLNREWAGTPVRVHAIEEYYRAAEVEFPQALKRRGLSDAAIGTHAGLADTSLSLALDPQLVRLGRLHSGSVAANAEGVAGDPRGSTAELGQLGVDLIVARTVEAIRTSTARHH